MSKLKNWSEKLGFGFFKKPINLKSQFLGYLGFLFVV